MPPDQDRKNISPVPRRSRRGVIASIDQESIAMLGSDHGGIGGRGTDFR